MSFDEYNVTENIVKSDYVVDQTSMDKRLEKIYLEELEKNVISKFEENGYTVKKCTIDAVLDTTKKNAGIHLITIKIKGPADEAELAKVKSELASEYEIDESKINIIKFI